MANSAWPSCRNLAASRGSVTRSAARNLASAERMRRATWRNITVAGPVIGAGLLLLPRWGRDLNLLTLGEREARHLGVETERVRLLLIVLTALITGVAVAVCGTIGFVGLVVPHLIRLIAGPDHRVLVPASALGGALLVTLTDLVARTIAAPVEIPLGVITALTGGPFFLWLLHRTRRRPDDRSRRDDPRRCPCRW